MQEQDVGPSRASAKLLVGIRIGALLAMAVLMVRLAWLGDDSLITLRTALNATHGLGFGFNPGEAVQAYTHPLWFLVWTGLGAVSHEWILSIIFLSLVLSLTAVAVVLWRAPTVWVVIATASSLLLSNAFMEYTTSGLENPLAYAFAAAAIALTGRGVGDGRWWLPVLVGLTLAGLILTRFDLAIIVLPVVAVMVWQGRHSSRTIVLGVAAAVVPLLAWGLWSWATYSTLLPNTFAAKRNLDIPQSDLALQGFRYLVFSAAGDLWTTVVLVVALGLSLARGTLIVRAWAIGTVMYLAYAVVVGGDFMAGRFLAVPVLVAVACCVEIARHRFLESPPVDPHASQPHLRQVVGGALIFLALPLLLLVVARQPPTAITAPTYERWDDFYSAGITDERGFYAEMGRGVRDWLMNTGAEHSGFQVQKSATANPALSLGAISDAADQWPDATDEASNASDVGVACGLLGSLAISTGPATHWIDVCGLTDAFLASQPFAPSDGTWRPGHYVRALPDGYVDAVQSGDPTLVTDPGLRKQLEVLWQKIR